MVRLQRTARHVSGLKRDTVVVGTRKVAPKKEGTIHFGPEMYHYGPLTEDSRIHLVVVLTRKVILKRRA